MFINKYVVFTSYGLLFFKHCRIYSHRRFLRYGTMYFYRSHFEVEPSLELVKEFHSNGTGLKIVIDHCEIDSDNSGFIFINVMTQVHVIRSKDRYRLYAEIGNQTLTNFTGFTFIKLIVENSSIDNFDMSVFGYKSIGFLKIENTVIDGSVSSRAVGFFLGYLHFNNCTFYRVKIYGINAQSVLQVKIIKCKFNPTIGYTKCKYIQGCIVNVKRLGLHQNNYKLIFSLFPNCKFGECVKLYIRNSEFVGSLGGVIKCEDMHLELVNCRFSLKENRLISPEGGFIYHDYIEGEFSATNVTFDASLVQSNMLVSIMELRCNNVLLRNTHILCPKSLGVSAKKRELSFMYLHHYVCQKSCTSSEYTYQAGSMFLSSFINKYHSLSANDTKENKPVCSSCPIGANCNNHIKALPNYWGYKDKSDIVSMIRCPNGYCCQGDDTCREINSCNANRTGPLCGRCRGNWTESLFSPKCLLVDDCPAGLILMLYIGGAVAYGLGLMAISFIKDVGPAIVKNILKVLTKRILCSKGETHKVENEHEESQSLMKQCKTKDETKVPEHKDDSEDDDFMKYIKILFYYIQDAALFKIQLPRVDQQEESIVVKILQFSPEVFVVLYSKVSDLCFTPLTTAVTKIWFSSLFGPCVMIFIFILYLCQIFISKFFHKSGKMFRARVVQTFLLVVLFSFQKMVIGAFTLVQCVNKGTKTILYVQGDIECYTWWQRTIEAYIMLNIIPAFLALSQMPFYVQKKEMSVRMFITGCFLPIPVLVIYHFRRVRTWVRKRLSDNVTVVSEQIEIQRAPRSDVDWNKKVDEFFLRMIKHPDCVDSDDSCDASIDTLGQRYNISESDTDIGSEYSTDLINVKQIVSNVSNQASVSSHGTMGSELKSEKVKIKYKFNNSREAITYTLLKDYRPLSVCNVQFTWLGIHKIYRVGLVACSTYITDPWSRLYTMTMILLVMSVTTGFVQPYENRTTNKVAILSYVANICIAVVNVWKTALATYGCTTNCESHKDMTIFYMGMVEDVLLSYIPAVVVPVAFFFHRCTKV